MNRVPIESYLRSVVPAESPSSWGGTNGSAPGHARARRPGGRRPLLRPRRRHPLRQPADTCDDIFCQVYRGFGTNTAGAVEVFESTNGDLAVAQTAGQIRRTRCRRHRPHRVLVVDRRLHRRRRRSPPSPTTATTWPPTRTTTGRSRSPSARSRRAFDAFAGPRLRRVRAVRRHRVPQRPRRGRRPHRAACGPSFGRQRHPHREPVPLDVPEFGVKSDWFVVPPPTSTSTFNDTAGNAHEANIEKIADAGIAAGFPDGGFHPERVR